jgi:hypothetical protein
VHPTLSANLLQDKPHKGRKPDLAAVVAHELVKVHTIYEIADEVYRLLRGMTCGQEMSHDEGGYMDAPWVEWIPSSRQ